MNLGAFPPAGKENYPEFWEQGLQFARMRYEAIVEMGDQPRTSDELMALVREEIDSLQERLFDSLQEAHEQAVSQGMQYAWQPEGIQTTISAAMRGLVELLRPSIGR